MSAIEEQIGKVIEEKINPTLADHLGQAVLTGVEEGIAYVKLTGACSSCPASADTFEYIVKQNIVEACPEIQDVVLDTSVSEELLDMARKILNKEVRPE